MAAAGNRTTFKHAVNVSDVRAGPVLFQEVEDGLDYHASFFCKTFDKLQVNWSTIPKKL